MKKMSKPTQTYYFNPYGNIVQEGVDELKEYLDDLQAQDILRRIIDDVYKSGFCDGLEFSKWLEN